MARKILAILLFVQYNISVMLKNGSGQMKKLPYGISDYERLAENDYYYVDKTFYIKKLENIANELETRRTWIRRKRNKI